MLGRRTTCPSAPTEGGESITASTGKTQVLSAEVSRSERGGGGGGGYGGVTGVWRGHRGMGGHRSMEGSQGYGGVTGVWRQTLNHGYGGKSSSLGALFPCLKHKSYGFMHMYDN